MCVREWWSGVVTAGTSRAAAPSSLSYTNYCNGVASSCSNSSGRTVCVCVSPAAWLGPDLQMSLTYPAGKLSRNRSWTTSSSLSLITLAFVLHRPVSAGPQWVPWTEVCPAGPYGAPSLLSRPLVSNGPTVRPTNPPEVFMIHPPPTIHRYCPV